MTRNAAILAVFLLLVPLQVFAEDPPQAPTITGSYNPDTQGLTLDWTPRTPAPNGSVYTLYRNGVQILTTTATTTTRDLTLLTEGFRNYTVSVTFPGTPESVRSLGFTVTKNIVLPASCPVASLTLYTRPPGATYTIYDECIPR